LHIPERNTLGNKLTKCPQKFHFKLEFQRNCPSNKRLICRLHNFNGIFQTMLSCFQFVIVQARCWKYHLREAINLLPSTLTFHLFFCFPSLSSPLNYILSLLHSYSPSLVTFVDNFPTISPFLPPLSYVGTVWATTPALHSPLTRYQLSSLAALLYHRRSLFSVSLFIYFI